MKRVSAIVIILLLFILIGLNVHSFWDLSIASYDDINIPTQSTNPQGIDVSSDGTKIYEASDSGVFYEYSCSTAWDLSSCVYDNNSLDVSSTTGASSGYWSDIDFSSDGTKMYALHGANYYTIYQHSCSTAWDLSSCVYDNNSLDVSAQDSIPLGLDFSFDGTKMYIAGELNDTFYEYSCSTAWDLSSCVYDNKSINCQNVQCQSIQFSSDGTKMYGAGNYSVMEINQFNCSTAWDLSSCSHSKTITPQDSSPIGVVFKTNGAKMYEIGTGEDEIYQWSLPSFPHTLIVQPNGVDGNYLSGSQGITFDVNDADIVSNADGNLFIDIYYSSAQYSFTTAIVSDGNLFDSSIFSCEDYNFSDTTRCTYSWDTTAIADGNYFIDLNVFDDSDVNAVDSSDASFIVDNTAPSTTDDAPSGWQTADVNIHLTCSDGTGSGCSITQYRVNSGSWQTYDTNILFDSDGNFQLDYNSSDLVGSIETTKTVWVAIDSVAPSTSDDHLGNWQTTDQNVHLTCSDSTSGCNITQYRIDSGAWQTYDSNILFSSDGNYQLDYNSTDIAGLVESTHTIWIAIETISPTTTDNAPSGWQTSDFSITLSCSDANSGCDTTYYSVDGSAFVSGNTVNITTDGNHGVSYYSVDVAGNIETTHDINAPLDKTAPIYSLGSPDSNKANQSVSQFTFAVKLSDATSGARRCFWTTYKNGTVQDNGVVDVNSDGYCEKTVSGMSNDDVWFVRWIGNDYADNNAVSIDSNSYEYDTTPDDGGSSSGGGGGSVTVLPGGLGGVGSFCQNDLDCSAGLYCDDNAGVCVRDSPIAETIVDYSWSDSVKLVSSDSNSEFSVVLVNKTSKDLPLVVSVDSNLSRYLSLVSDVNSLPAFGVRRIAWRVFVDGNFSGARGSVVVVVGSGRAVLSHVLELKPSVGLGALWGYRLFEFSQPLPFVGRVLTLGFGVFVVVVVVVLWWVYKRG